MAQIRAEDLAKIKTWRSIGLLADVDQNTLKGLCQDGLIPLFCGDGDRSLEFREHLKKMGCYKRPHLQALDGGPIRIVREAPIPKKFRIHNQLIHELLFSRQAKKIPTLVLCAHYPCGMAQACHITLPDIVYYNLRAAEIMIKRGWDKKRVVPLIHIYDGQKERTYFIEKEKRHLIFA